MRVLVAMSGGVDSSVVAGLLHEAGHEVVGVTLQLYDQRGAGSKKGACCAGQDIHDAKRVADRLGISHYVIDAEARFRRAVIDDFVDSYALGETPIPCVRCNQSVKFADLTALAADLGAERLATGHYVRRVDGPEGAELHRAVDASRDQSYFLFATTRAQLERCVFPLGDMPDKAHVRAVAARLGLAVAEKPDSQDICFVPPSGYGAFVASRRPEAAVPGEIVTSDGAVVGQHDGIIHYTVGQGKRLGVAAQWNGERQVVVALDATTRRVVVGKRGVGVRRLSLREVHWLVEPAERVRCMVKLRAREAPHGACVRDAGAVVELDVPSLPAPGQACVFYEGTRVIGGGFIRRGEVAAVDRSDAAGLIPPPRDGDGGVAQW